ncbi:hypothetical protein [Bacillus sp. EB600]|uniref:hypothetical protein n=1 Tax=Bacillus sp. EB600 TaxID=2806345 RepID=UPI00210F177F|nr:hypothetical protein [Bacillus sp. EB600]MCQ6280972.1 NAD(P)-dependent oxidoreductase [Bacillus sp. EB600]
MDKVIIYGVHEFVGFHLCKGFLEKGYCVTGIHFNMEDALFVEEKRLEVGRNANFVEKALQDSDNLSEAESGPAIIIISLYDLLMTYKESALTTKKVFANMVQSLNKQKQTKNQIVYLLPIQLITGSNDLNGIEDVKDFLKETKRKDRSIQLVYLPTIFGPWQPPSFLFQRLLLNQLNKIEEQIVIREWPFDAIFINDALDPMFETIQTGKPGSFLLESGIPESWKRCADFLKIDQSIKSECESVDIKSDEQIVKLSLQNITPYSESLTIQREHISLLRDLEDES